MRDKLVLENSESNMPGDLAYKGKHIRVYTDNNAIYAFGEGYSRKWYFDDKDSADKLCEAFSKTKSSRADFVKCLEAFGYRNEKEIKEAHLDSLVSKLNEELEMKDPLDVKRFVFNIQCLDLDDITHSESYDLHDLPEEVIEWFAEEVKKHPSNQVRIYNQLAYDREKEREWAEEDDEDV